MAHHNEIGAWGEEIVAQQLESIASVSPGQRADLNFMGIEIEVKTATLSKYNGRHPGYQFSIRREGHSTLRAPVLILICAKPDPDFFIIPADVVGERRKLGLPANLDDYNGLWAPYRNRWDLLADMLEEA
jgi:hypothetical protein